MDGETIAGRYRLLEPLGRGAMSAVWLAEDSELGRRVAVKMLGENADRARFEREARAAAALSHPHICQLYDYGEADGRPYMVLEYLSGGTLEDLLRAGKPLDDPDASRLAAEIASGLAHAHARGLVHRDLKPANVLFDQEGRAKIADFGIARIGADGTLTEAGTVLGTASYISPEQAAGQPATPASDVYSFGVILFRMLTGSLPFTSQNAMELVRMHRDDPPPAVADLRPDAPPRLESVAMAALAKDPADRPADGAALVSELTSARGDATTVLAAGSSAATQIASAAPARRPRRGPRSAVPLVLGAAIALLVAGVAVALVATTGEDSGDAGTTTLPNGSLSLPNIAPGRTTSSQRVTTEERITTSQATSSAATSTRATTTRATATRATTAVPTTTRRATTTVPTTATLPATTFATTTDVTTTDVTTTTPP